MNESRNEPQRRITANVSIGNYLIQRLRDYGIEDVFGIPGDYVLSFYSELEKSPSSWPVSKCIALHCRTKCSR